MKGCKICNFLALVMILLAICFSATATEGTPHWLDAIPNMPELQQWLDTVADMEQDRVFVIWSLDEKIRFIDALKNAGYEIDSEHYSKIMNNALDAESRMTSADHIIDSHYGTERRAYPDSTRDKELSTYLIFEVAYYKEFPNATKQEMIDACEFWRRDVSRRRAVLQEQAEPTPSRVIDEATVIHFLSREIVEMFFDGIVSPYYDPVRGIYVNEDLYSWVVHTFLETANITAVFNDEYQVWHCIGTISKESVKAIVDTPETSHMEADLEERLLFYIEEGSILDLGESYEIQMVLNPFGTGMKGGVAPVKSLAKSAAEITTQIANEELWSNYQRKCIKIAWESVMSRFALSYEELDRYFMSYHSLFPDEDDNWQALVLFKEHYTPYDKSNWTYGVVVNLETGELLDCFTKDMLREREPIIGKPLPSWPETDIDYDMRWYTEIH